MCPECGASTGQQFNCGLPPTESTPGESPSWTCTRCGHGYEHDASEDWHNESDAAYEDHKATEGDFL